MTLRSKTAWSIVLAAVVLVMIPALAGAGRDHDAAALARAKAAYFRRDYGPARPVMVRLAGRGVAEAQYYLGLMHYFGRGFPRDMAAGAAWFARAARQGQARAMASLGYCYALGRGVKADLIRAYMWTTLAGERGLAVAARMSRWIAARMTQVQIQKAGRRAARFRPSPERPR